MILSSLSSIHIWTPLHSLDCGHNQLSVLNISLQPSLLRMTKLCMAYSWRLTLSGSFWITFSSRVVKTSLQLGYQNRPMSKSMKTFWQLPMNTSSSDHPLYWRTMKLPTDWKIHQKLLPEQSAPAVVCCSQLWWWRRWRPSSPDTTRIIHRAKYRIMKSIKMLKNYQSLHPLKWVFIKIALTERWINLAYHIRQLKPLKVILDSALQQLVIIIEYDSIYAFFCYLLYYSPYFADSKCAKWSIGKIMTTVITHSLQNCFTNAST